eukprot:SAG31_NODE_3578_length_4103_cov_1.960789_5_plen_93_part_00
MQYVFNAHVLIVIGDHVWIRGLSSCLASWAASFGELIAQQGRFAALEGFVRARKHSCIVKGTMRCQQLSYFGGQMRKDQINSILCSTAYIIQ